MSDCAICRDPLTAQQICAGNMRYHPDCFACIQCLRPFPEGKFFEVEGGLYCDQDYQALFGSRCARCGENIMGACVNALDLKWHPHHLTCDECGCQLSGTSFVKKLGRPFCKPCSNAMRERELQRNKNMCARCKKPIDGEILRLNGQKFHPFHFYCATCRRELNETAKELDNKLYCPSCYEKATAASCGACHKPIQGRSITALGKQWHPEHFVCAKCEKPFSGGSFYEWKGNPYCETHYNEFSGISCGRCGKSPSGRAISALNKEWCEYHFTCISCEVDITDTTGSKYVEWDAKPMCKDCYTLLPGDIRKKVAKYNDIEKKVKEGAK